MPRLLGLAQASKIYRNHEVANAERFSNKGNEIAWGTIGNASTSEGMFFEAINAAGVLQVPMVMSVWDDNYGISVSNKDQTTKENISSILQGLQRTESDKGYEIFTVKGWDYTALLNTYEKAEKIAREEHVPILIHVTELTQPLGHSTSGSHERYKSKTRLEWEKENDCNLKMREWILSNGIATESVLNDMEQEAKKEVRQARRTAWSEFQEPIEKERKIFFDFHRQFLAATHNDISLQLVEKPLAALEELSFFDVVSAARKTKMILNRYPEINTDSFLNWLNTLNQKMEQKVSSKLYTVSEAQLKTYDTVLPVYGDTPNTVDGRVILRDNFEILLKEYSTLYIFGEDCGAIGDVNQGLEGLQQKIWPTSSG